MAQISVSGRSALHNLLGNRNIVGQHSSESAGVLSPSSINPNDIGKNWVLTTAYIADIEAMEYCGSGIVLASTDTVAGNPHILRSTDHGRIFFDSITLPIGGGNIVRSISYLGNGIVVLGTTNGHIWRSTDFGLTFTDLGAISAFDIRNIKYLGHGYVIASDSGGFVQRSTDFGATWPLAIGVTANIIQTTSYLDNGIAILGDANGHIWRSTTILTGFPSFSDRGDVTGTNTPLLALAYLGNGVVTVGTGNGHIIRSTDFGLTWTDLGLISASFFDVSAYLGNGVAIYGTFNGHIWRSTDYGLNWTDIVDITASNLLQDTLKYIGNGVIIVGDTLGNIFRSDISYKLDESIQDIERPIRTVTTSETLTKIDETLLVDATAGNITIFLPSITVASEHVFNFVRIDATANTVTIDGAGTETINLALTQPLNVQFMALSMKAKPFAPNAGWWII